MPPSHEHFIIEPYQVEHKLAAINLYKANGPDDIPNWFLREFSPWFAEPVCAIFSASVRQGIVPHAWKQVNVIAVPKTNPPKVINKDLRPISLTLTLSKLIESFIGQWILSELVTKLTQDSLVHSRAGRLHMSWSWSTFSTIGISPLTITPMFEWYLSTMQKHSIMLITQLLLRNLTLCDCLVFLFHGYLHFCMIYCNELNCLKLYLNG